MLKAELIFLVPVIAVALFIQTMALISLTKLRAISSLVTGLSIAAMFSMHLNILITLAYLHIALLMFVVSQTGGLYKGSSTYATLLFFITIDMSAYFALLLPYSWAYWILILPGLSRILFPLTSPYSRGLFVNCPTEIILLFLGGTVPIGIVLLMQISAHCPHFDFLDIATLGSSFFAAILFLIEKSRRQKAIYLFMTQTALCARLMLGPYTPHVQHLGSLLCLVALLNSSIWLYWLDFPKIRFFNISLAAVTLFLLVYQP